MRLQGADVRELRAEQPVRVRGRVLVRELAQGLPEHGRQLRALLGRLAGSSHRGVGVGGHS